MTSSASRAAGTARARGSISGYRATNYCKPPLQKLTGPPTTCRTNSGRTRVSLIPGDLPEGADPDLAPLSGRPLLLSVWRSGGGTQGTACVGRAADRIIGEQAPLSLLTTSPAATPSLTLGARLDAIKLFALKGAKRIRRSIRISGPCSNVTVTVQNPPGGAPSPGALNADGDCWMTGRIVLNMRARR